MARSQNLPVPFIRTAKRRLTILQAALTKLTIGVSYTQEVSALVLTPPEPVACYVLAHGAGAGMTHRFMADTAEGLARRRVATLRYQFPFMEAGSRRPDAPPAAQATVRAAVAAAAWHFPSLPLVAGGKSFGGRMTSQAQAKAPLPGVAGLALLGFRCTRPENHPPSGLRTCPTSRSPCCSFKEHGTPWRIDHS